MGRIMATQKAQFDFRRYGKFLLVGAAIVGLFLCRDAGGCIKQVIIDFELSGARDNDSSSGVVSDQGLVKKGTEGDYAGDVRKGSTFFGLVGDSIPHCVEKSSFSHPIYLFYIFWGLFGLGMAFRLIDRFVGPSWKDGVRSREEEHRNEQREIDKIEAQRLEERRSKRKGGSTKGLDVPELADRAPQKVAKTKGQKVPEKNSILKSLLIHEEDENARRGHRPHSRYSRDE